MKGVIVKGVGGFYYVKTDEGVLECNAKGRFRKDEIVPMVGDIVDVDIKDENHGFIIEIMQRRNVMIRPPVANIDQVIICSSIKDPELNLLYIDKLILLCMTSNIRPVVCINKIDLAKSYNYDEIKVIYNKAGYNVILTSTRDDIGIVDLKNTMKDKTSAMAGPSGVGKSSLLNKVQPGLNLKTGDISKKISRGKHTTRHVELLKLDIGGYVLDTPGFGAIDIDFLTREEVEKYYQDFSIFSTECRFRGCLHISEPGCMVKEAVKTGEISKRRYDNYLKIQDEVKKAEERRYF